MSKPNNVFKPGGFLALQTFTIDGKLLKYVGAYGKYATVPISSISTVTISPVSWGKSSLKIVGQGTDLANIIMATPWCMKTQEWLLDKLNI